MIVTTCVIFLATLYVGVKLNDVAIAAQQRKQRHEIPDQRAIAEEHAAKRRTAQQRKQDLADLRRGTSDNVEVRP